MKDCTYSRYSDRRTRDYIARFGAFLAATPFACCRRVAGRSAGMGRLLSAGPRSQPLRRESASRRGPPCARQPDPGLAADRRGLVTLAALDRTAAIPGRSALSDRALRV